MSAYVIADVKVTDPARYKEYLPLSLTAIHAAGGRILVRGGRAEALEGDWVPTRVVVVEFPSFEAAQAFHASAAYAAARACRAGATKFFRMIVVEGAG